MPSTRTLPSVTSKSRQISDTSVDLPEPVEPTTAVVVPGRAVSETPCNTGRSAPSCRNVAFSSRISPMSGCGGTVPAPEVSIAGRVESTSVIRSAHTDARGMITRMNVAIRTATRICMK